MASTTLERITSSVFTLSGSLFSRVDRAAGRMPSDLTIDQMVDAGIDPAEIISGPVIHVNAPIMTTLMSLR